MRFEGYMVEVDWDGTTLRAVKRIVVSLLALAAITGCGGQAASEAPPGATPTPSLTTTPIVVTGYITADIDTQSAIKIEEKENPSIGDGPCLTKDGYGDIKDGAQVTFTDEVGKVIQLANLNAAGLWVDKAGTLGILGDCRFNFAATLPGGGAFYGIEVAHRGVVRFTAEQLKTEVRLTLG